MNSSAIHPNSHMSHATATRPFPCPPEKKTLKQKIWNILISIPFFKLFHPFFFLNGFFKKERSNKKNTWEKHLCFFSHPTTLRPRPSELVGHNGCPGDLPTRQLLRGGGVRNHMKSRRKHNDYCIYKISRT